MAEILLNIIGISALIAVPSNSILLGLNSGKLNFREIFGKKKILIKYILTMFVITPLLVVILFLTIGPYNGVWTAMFIIAVTPAAPSIVKYIDKLGCDKNISLAWLVITIFLSLIFVPLNLLIVENIVNMDIDLSVFPVFIKLMTLFIIPILAGFLFSKYFKDKVPIITKFLEPVSKLAMIALVLSLLIIAVPLMIKAGIFQILLILIFILIALTIAHIMGSPDQAYGPILPYSVILRLPAPAIVISQVNHTVQKHMVVIISFTIIGIIVISIYNKIFFGKKSSK
jgi:predicted Na+-dependent transporter